SSGDIVGRQIGIEIGACQRRCGLGPFAGRSVAYPLQKLTDNHWHNLTRPTAIVHIDGTAEPNRRRLTYRSPYGVIRNTLFVRDSRDDSQINVNISAFPACLEYIREVRTAKLAQ